MSDEYESFAKGKLKLKTDTEFKKKKKKKDKNKEINKIKQAIGESASCSSKETSNIKNKSSGSGRQLTKAEMAFKQMQEKMQKKRILDKASMTHKQRVEKFNEHLDTLTEHFDIPKVSWTK